jgi:LEA14-like dessication related protein
VNACRRASTFVASALVVVGGLAGCATIGRQAFGKPTVSLENVRMTGIGIAGGNLEVVLKVYNPNEYRLDASNFHYEVEIDSTELAHGTLDRRFTVLPKDSTIVRIPVSFSYAALGAAGRAIWNAGALNYHVRGDITVLTPLGSRTIPFVQQGRYDTVGGTS